jgi:hypothetical protein
VVASGIQKSSTETVPKNDKRPKKRSKTDTSKTTQTVSYIRVGRAALVAFVMSFGFGLVTFGLGVLVILFSDSTGIIDKMNALLGGILQLSVPNLISLMLLLSIVIVLILTIMVVLMVVLYNAASAFVGGLSLIVEGNEE